MTEVKAADTGYAPESWEFDEEVTRVFDDMLKRSIPQYETMRKSVLDVGLRFLPRGHHLTVVDLGCSRGESIARFRNHRNSLVKYVGCEVSQPMIHACRERFRSSIDRNDPTTGVDIREIDLRDNYPAEPANLTLAILALQFMPINYRQRIIQNAYDHTLKRGAFIMVEKVLGSTAEIDTLMVEAYHALKRQHGYTADDIERKKFALEGKLVPVTSKWNEEMLRDAGFRQVDCFWRWMNFAAWVAVK